jgi:hypothetical protein
LDLTLYPKQNNRFILVLILTTIVLWASVQTIIPIIKAEFTPPSTTDWVGSGDTSGIFSSGQIVFNITSGSQYKPTQPVVKFRSNTTDPINLGNCVADFRLIQVEDNNTFTEVEYARFPIHDISSKSGYFWASTVKDYPSTNRVGIVIWNASDGAVVGRLIRTVQATDEPTLSLKSDKAEFGLFDPIGFTIINHGPPMKLYGEFEVYRFTDGLWRSVSFSNGALVDYGTLTLEHNATLSYEVPRVYIDFSQSGVYLLEIGDMFGLSCVFKVSSDVFTSSNESNRFVWVSIGVTVGAFLGLAFFYFRKRIDCARATSFIHRHKKTIIKLAITATAIYGISWFFAFDTPGFTGYYSLPIKEVHLNTTDMVKRAKSFGYYVGNDTVSHRIMISRSSPPYPSVSIYYSGSTVQLSIDCITRQLYPKACFYGFFDDIGVPRSILDEAVFKEDHLILQ